MVGIAEKVYTEKTVVSGVASLKLTTFVVLFFIANIYFLELAACLQFRQHLLGDFFQGLEHSGALKGDSFNYRLVLFAELFAEDFGG